MAPCFLLFRLYGPLAAWGEIAVGERRASLPHPGKSAILGLIAGSLGVHRAESERLMAIHRGYGIAVRVWPDRRRLVDYHTMQSASGRTGFSTRAEELAQPKLNTILSTREYVQEGLADVAIWVLETAPATLDAIAQALENPVFAPYLGRKSCPPALPFQPQIVGADGLEDAYRKADDGWQQSLDRFNHRRAWMRIPDRAAYLVWEDGVAGTPPVAHQRQMRRDQMVSAKARLFSERPELSRACGLETDKEEASSCL